MSTAVVPNKADANIDGRSRVIAKGLAVVGRAGLIGGSWVVAVTVTIRRGHDTARKARSERENTE